MHEHKSHLSAVIAVSFLAMFAQGAIGLELLFDPAEVGINSVGQEFSLDVTIQNASDVAGYQMAIQFDPDILEVIDVFQGSYLEEGGATVLPAPGTIDNIAGTIVGYAWARVGSSVSSSSGILATVNFRTKVAKTGHFSSEITQTGSLLSDPASSSITIDTLGIATVANDDDGDGVPNNMDQCPNTPPNTPVDANGCPDSDGDGVPDGDDLCPNTPPNMPVDANGCPDSDGDGVPDNLDLCANTPSNAPVDANGCPDSDGDGVPDNMDLCPNTPPNTPVEADGCTSPDSDGDGVPDIIDLCPNTPPNTPVDPDGCPIPPSVQPPINPTPTSGTTGQSNYTVVSWSNGGGATSYDVYFGGGAGPSGIRFQGNQTGTSYDPETTLPYDTWFYWKVVAKNSSGDTAEGEVWSFRTVPSPCPDICNPNCSNYSPDRTCAKSALKFLPLASYEEVLPLDLKGAPNTVIQPWQPIAIRLAVGDEVDPETVWCTVEGDLGYAAVGGDWLPSYSQSNRDGWVVFTPSEAYQDGEYLTVVAGAMKLDGSEIEPLSYSFVVNVDAATESLESFVVEEEVVPYIDVDIATQLTLTYRVGPVGVFAEPVSVQIPVPEGYTADELTVYYYSESERHEGWFLADRVLGLVVPYSQQTILINGQEFIELTVNHSAVLALGVSNEVSVASLGPVNIATRGSSISWVSFLGIMLFWFVALGTLLQANRRRVGTAARGPRS